MPRVTEQDGGVDGSRPEWFAAFLADRGTRKHSMHALTAYRPDFDAIAALIAGSEDLSKWRWRHHDRHPAQAVRAVCETP